MKRVLSGVLLGVGMSVALATGASADTGVVQMEGEVAQVCTTCPNCGKQRAYNYNYNYQQNAAAQQYYRAYLNAAMQARNNQNYNYRAPNYNYNYNRGYRGGNNFYRSRNTGNTVSNSGGSFYIMGNGFSYSNF